MSPIHVTAGRKRGDLRLEALSSHRENSLMVIEDSLFVCSIEIDISPPLRVYLQSPGGTRSTLLHNRPQVLPQQLSRIYSNDES